MKRRGPGVFSPANTNVAPGYFHRKIEIIDSPSCLIPRLLVIFTWQFEFLVTSLWMASSFCL